MGPVLAWKGPGQRTPRGHLSQSPCGPCDPAGWGGGAGVSVSCCRGGWRSPHSWRLLGVPPRVTQETSSSL